jgi:hypothetical protein
MQGFFAENIFIVLFIYLCSLLVSVIVNAQVRTLGSEGVHRGEAEEEEEVEDSIAIAAWRMQR